MTQIMVTQELIDKIAFKYKEGDRKEQIVESLLAEGWEEKDIEDAIVELRRMALHQLPIVAYFTKQMAILDTKTSNIKLHTWIIVLILMAFLVGGLAYFLNDTIDPMGQKAAVRDEKRQVAFTQLKAAIEKYYRNSNSYPATLGQLVPKYIQNIPLDPSTNSPYPYRIIDDNINYELCVEYEQYNSQCVSSKSYEIKATDDSSQVAEPIPTDIPVSNPVPTAISSDNSVPLRSTPVTTAPEKTRTGTSSINSM